MDSIDEARILAALAGIRLSDEREPAVAFGLEAMRRIAEALGRRDYGEIEPACRFTPPQRSGR
jgi:hypothetical protein